MLLFQIGLETMLVKAYKLPSRFVSFIILSFSAFTFLLVQSRKTVTQPHGLVGRWNSLPLKENRGKLRKS